MDKHKLATEIVDFFYEFKNYDFQEQIKGDREYEIHRIYSSLFNIESINQIIIKLMHFSNQMDQTSNNEEYEKINYIIKELNNYKDKNSLDVIIIDKEPYHKVIMDDYETIEREINDNASIYAYKDDYYFYCSKNSGETNNDYFDHKIVVIAHEKGKRRSLTTQEVKQLIIDINNLKKKEKGRKDIC